MQPNDLVRVKLRHGEFNPEAVEDPNALHLSQIHNDREELIEEVERLQSNFDVVIDSLQDFLNHHARILPPDITDRIRLVAKKARGLK